jgi:hypothetical protein
VQKSLSLDNKYRIKAVAAHHQAGGMSARKMLRNVSKNSAQSRHKQEKPLQNATAEKYKPI